MAQQPISEYDHEDELLSNLLVSSADGAGIGGDCSLVTGAHRSVSVGSRKPFLVSATPTWKRAMDVFGALLGLVLLAPLFLAVVLIIRITAGRPVFFLQQRVGRLGQPFTMWKFRTMKNNAGARKHQQYVASLIDTDATLQKLNRDSQLIPMGKWLRRSGIDELPQLVNVLLGNMSLVGPRPDVLPLHRYQGWHRHRFDVLPGITGLWQVSGKNRTTFKQMILLDVAYAKRRCLALDLKILFMTLPTILKELYEE